MSGGVTQTRARLRFGLDTVLPSDPATVEADVLRVLECRRPDVLAVRPSRSPDRRLPPGHREVPPLPRGVPDLVLLGPGGRTACLAFHAQADRPTREETAFADLCRQHGIPFAAVRSTAEARRALARFGLLDGEA